MPDYMTIEQTYRLVGGYTAVNLLRFVDIGGDFDLTTVNAIVNSWGSDVVNASLDQDCIADGDVRAYIGFPEPTAELFSSTDDHAGGSTGELYSASACYVVDISAGAGRTRKGRLFLPGVDEAKVEDGGILQGTTQADILANVAGWVADVASNQNWLLGVGSLVEGVVNTAQSVGVKPYIGSQRRRLARVSYSV